MIEIFHNNKCSVRHAHDSAAQTKNHGACDVPREAFHAKPLPPYGERLGWVWSQGRWGNRAHGARYHALFIRACLLA